MTANLRNSNFKGKNILLLLHPSLAPSSIEARIDSDPDLQRCKLYSTSDIHEAKVFIKNYQINLAIFSEVDGQNDFVFIQNELKGSNPDIAMIPLVDKVLSISQIQASRNIGNVYTYGQSGDGFTYEILKGLIFSYFRDENHKNKLISNLEEITRSLTLALNLNEKLISYEIKTRSNLLIDEILSAYDLSEEENALGIIANRIFFPSLSLAEYDKILVNELSSLTPIIKQVGNWITNTSPTSSAGFAITLSHVIAQQSLEKKTFDEIFALYNSRPIFLKHVSMRAISEEKLHQIYSRWENEQIRISNG